MKIQDLETDILLTKLETDFFDEDYKIGYIEGLEAFAKRYKQNYSLIDLKRYLIDVTQQGYKGSYVDGFVFAYKGNLSKLEKELKH
nr:hypothetical protein [Clostridioides sp.]